MVSKKVEYIAVLKEKKYMEDTIVVAASCQKCQKKERGVDLKPKQSLGHIFDLRLYNRSNVLTCDGEGVSSCNCSLIHKCVLYVLTLMLYLAIGLIFNFHLHGFVRWEVLDGI